MGDQTKPMLKNKQPMFQACVCEPLEKVIEGKLIVVVVKMEKREWLRDIWTIALQSMTQGSREEDWERQPNELLVCTPKSIS